MSQAKKIIVGLVLTVAPLVTVYQLKQTAWGTFQATPESRMTGDPHAAVLLVEYADFQCPMCAHVQPTLHQFLDTYKGKVRLASKYFPLSMHRNSLPSAHAAQCAAEQNQFWSYADQLYQTQPQWETLADPTTTYTSIAQAVHLDMDRFNTCYADPSKLGPVEQDRAEGQSRQITATPTLFVGDERLVGSYIETDGARVIERKLRQ